MMATDLWLMRANSFVGSDGLGMSVAGGSWLGAGVLLAGMAVGENRVPAPGAGNPRGPEHGTAPQRLLQRRGRFVRHHGEDVLLLVLPDEHAVRLLGADVRLQL